VLRVVEHALARRHECRVALVVDLAGREERGPVEPVPEAGAYHAVLDAPGDFTGYPPLFIQLGAPACCAMKPSAPQAREAGFDAELELRPDVT